MYNHGRAFPVLLTEHLIIFMGKVMVGGWMLIGDCTDNNVDNEQWTLLPILCGDHDIGTSAYCYGNHTPFLISPAVYDTGATKLMYHEAYICTWTPSTEPIACF